MTATTTLTDRHRDAGRALIARAHLVPVVLTRVDSTIEAAIHELHQSLAVMDLEDAQLRLRKAPGLIDQAMPTVIPRDLLAPLQAAFDALPDATAILFAIDWEGFEHPFPTVTTLGGVFGPQADGEVRMRWNANYRGFGLGDVVEGALDEMVEDVLPATEAIDAVYEALDEAIHQQGFARACADHHDLDEHERELFMLPRTDLLDAIQ
jgi:hypothetical protein